MACLLIIAKRVDIIKLVHKISLEKNIEMLAHKEMKKRNTDHAQSGMINMECNQFDNTRKAESLPESGYWWQRNLGNSCMQGIAVNGQASGKITTQNCVPKIQQKYSCGDSCSNEDEYMRIQTKLKIGPANDVYEKEADRVADQVMRMPTSVGQTSSAHHPLGMQMQRLSNSDSKDSNQQINLNQSGGCPLSINTRNYMEPRFGVDFGNVRLHTDEQAQETALKIQAKAFTFGNNIWIGKGEHEADKGLMAHELTHVVQQNGRSDLAIQRSCSDPDFCKPYATAAEEASAEWWIRNTYLRAEGLETFGTEVKSLYESFLSRSPGDSLAPVVFNSDSSYLVSTFKNSGDTTDDMDNVIDLVGGRLNRAPRGSLREGHPATMSLSNFLSTSEMENRPINYSNPFSVAGHIAGGISSSDAGADYRKITYANVTLEKTLLFGSTGYIKVELIPHYEVFDTIDFCPGDCGSPAEQLITIPMSRLEASGAAYDVPFKVIFTPETRSKRFWV